MWRRFENSLNSWLQSAKKPLMIVGARQVGKTYTIQKFLREKTKKFLEINLEIEKEIFDIFEETIKPEQIISRLEISLREKINIEETVLFFDEVQVSERFINSLKYFNEAKEPYKIICAGSLLGVKLNRFESSFPVGKVSFLEVGPMDFEEFLIACGENLLRDEIQTCYRGNQPLFGSAHNHALQLYREYLMIGGMPESVKNYVKESQQKIQYFSQDPLKQIDISYLADMNKYIESRQEGVKNEKIYNTLISQLAQEKSKKFKYSIIEEGGKKRKFETAIDWLVSSRMVLRCERVVRGELPLPAFVDNSSYKLYFSDVGLLSLKANLNAADLIGKKDYLFSGALTENYVAQQLAATGISLYYWSSQNTAEVDFVMKTKEDGIVPIEVKAKDNTRSKSLGVYFDKYHPKYMVRLSTKNFGFENKIKSVPLYAAWCLERVD